MRVTMTDRFVASVRSDAVRSEYWDTKVSLCLRVSPGADGPKSWSTLVTDAAGKRVRLTLGRYPEMPLASARAAALEAAGRAHEGDDPRPPRGVTVAMLVDSYIKKHVEPNIRRAGQVEGRLRRDVVRVVGHVPLAALHRRDLNRVFDEIVARGSPAAALRTFGDLRTMLRWAVARGDIDRDPSMGMKPPAAAKFRDRALSEREIKVLWNTLPNVFAKDVARILKLCLVTGQRMGEVTGITPEELNLDRAEWILPASRSKNKHAHSIPLSDMGIALFKAAKADAEGRPTLFSVTAHQISDLVTRNQTAINIEHWTAHDLRRTVITHMAQLGVTPIVLSAVANHRTGTKAGITLQVYSQYSYDKEKRDALNLWADRLAAIIRGEPAITAPRLRRSR
jgi:integrase